MEYLVMALPIISSERPLEYISAWKKETKDMGQFIEWETDIVHGVPYSVPRIDANFVGIFEQRKGFFLVKDPALPVAATVGHGT